MRCATRKSEPNSTHCRSGLKPLRKMPGSAGIGPGNATSRPMPALNVPAVPVSITRSGSRELRIGSWSAFATRKRRKPPRHAHGIARQGGDALADKARTHERGAANMANRAAEMEREAGDIEYTAPGGTGIGGSRCPAPRLRAAPGNVEEPGAGAGRPSARPATGDTTGPGPKGRPVRTGVRRTRPRGGRSRSRAGAMSEKPPPPPMRNSIRRVRMLR